MSKAIRENEFIKVTLIEVEHKEIDENKVLNKVNDYLSNNLIADEKYKCTGFHEFKTLSLEVDLTRVGDDLHDNGDIDEDFESDEGWDAFCKQMKGVLELNHFSVPYWYYSK